MTRQDWIWVAIRIFGIYLLILAITGIPASVSTGCSSYMLWRASGGGDIAGIWSTLWATRIPLLLGSVAGVVLYSVVGVYFLKSGRLVFRLVNWQGGPEEGLVK